MTDAAAAPKGRLELTLRALVLGCLLAVIFTAANTYLGLLVGLTFASAIPAAVISMAVLRAFRTSTIWENMTVQTVASVGGAMSSIIFVLPGLVMIGWWLEFPFWQSVAICILGGVLGVTFSIPLRRALVTGGGLPYPEGVAAAEVLKVGSRGAEQTESAVRENKSGLWVVVAGAVVSSGYALLVAGRVFAGEAAKFFKLPAALGGGATVAPLPRIDEVTDLDDPSRAYPVITGDYTTGVRWEPRDVVVGAPVAKPTPIFRKLDDEAVQRERELTTSAPAEGPTGER